MVQSYWPTIIMSAFTVEAGLPSKIIDRQKERIQQSFDYVSSQKNRIIVLEDQVNHAVRLRAEGGFSREIRTCTKTFDKLTISLISLWKDIWEVSYILRSKKIRTVISALFRRHLGRTRLVEAISSNGTWKAKESLCKLNNPSGYEVIEE